MPVGIYGSVSWLERLQTVLILLPLPFVTLYRLAVSYFRVPEKHKTWRRVLTDASFRYISSSLKVNQMQDIMGTTLGVYQKWARQNGVEVRVDELGEDTRLLWFTERATGMVVLYIHGGTYCLPLQDFGASFWKKTIDNINESMSPRSVGLVALNYSLIPTAYFPTQLKQTVLAIQHLTSTGIRPENIHIVGESAGGAIILQLLSHILHPLPDYSFPQLTLEESQKLGSACIMSPWVSLNGRTGSHLTNSDNDVLPASTWAYLGEQSLPSFNSESSRPYMEALNVPENWFSKIGDVVGRVMITVGENECLRDDVLEVAKKLEAVSGEKEFLTTVVDKNGVHNGQYLDIMAGEQQQGDLAIKIIRWLEKNLYNASP